MEVDDGNGNLVEKSSKEDVEKACMEENEQRFRQANDTPFMRSPLVEEFGYLGIGPNAEAVLNGTYVPPPGTDKYAAMLLEATPNAGVCKEFSESTSYYHDGAVCARVEAGKGEDNIRVTSFTFWAYESRDSVIKMIAEFEATMSHIPYATGYSPKRWRHVVDFELLKKEGVLQPGDISNDTAV